VSIKDELQQVKDELTSDEKILESAFKLERLYKKNKGLIWSILVLLIVGLGGNAAWNGYQQHKLNVANDAFMVLQDNPKDTKAATTLEQNNPKLYALFQLSQALKSGEKDRIKLIETSHDPLIADIAKYHVAMLEGTRVNSTYYHDLTVIEEAYVDLKAGKKSKARNKLSLISETSPVAKIAQLFKHYTVEHK